MVVIEKVLLENHLLLLRTVSASSVYRQADLPSVKNYFFLQGRPKAICLK